MISFTATARGLSQTQRTDLARCLAGATLIAVAWPIAWLPVRPLSYFYFFPIWLGYILVVDGLVALRTGASPMRRSGLRVAWMFAASILQWWIFEAFNEIVHNWTYLQPLDYSTTQYAILSSIAFATVIPAVLTTAELVRSFRLDPLRRIPAIRPRGWLLLAVHAAGWLMIAVTVAWPGHAFPLVWLSLIFLLDPLATVLGGRSIAWHVGRGDWSPVFNLGLAALVCGWFWELWNVYALPKWTYSIPHVEWLHIFEMPLLGYGGYIPFGIEVYAFYTAIRLLVPKVTWPDVRVSSRY
jgi:hypothetical protein